MTRIPQPGNCKDIRIRCKDGCAKEVANIARQRQFRFLSWHFGHINKPWQAMIGPKTPTNSLFCERNPSSKTRSWLKFQTQKVGIPWSPLSQIVFSDKTQHVFASKWWMIYLVISLRSFERFQGFLYISQTLPSFQQLDLPYSLSSPWPGPGLWTSPALPTSQRVSQCLHSLPAASVWREKSFAWMDGLFVFF